MSTQVWWYMLIILVTQEEVEVGGARAEPGRAKGLGA
jgi:hypothetical protein